MDINTLFKQACDNDKASEKELFRLLYARFGLFARQRIWSGQDSKEVAHVTVTAIWENYKTVRPEVSFAAWAQGVFENKIADYFRTRKRQQETFLRISDVEEPAAPWEIDPAARRKVLECLKKVNAVSPRHARILVLRYQGYDFDEICRRLKLTRNNAYSVLSRARSMLEACMEKGEIAE